MRQPWQFLSLWKTFKLRSKEYEEASHAKRRVRGSQAGSMVGAKVPRNESYPYSLDRHLRAHSLLGSVLGTGATGEKPNNSLPSWSLL